MREFWDGLPVKTAQVFKKQLTAAGVLLMDEDGKALEVERTVRGARVAHMVCLSIDKLEQFGLFAVVPAERDYSRVPDLPPAPTGFGMDD